MADDKQKDNTHQDFSSDSGLGNLPPLSDFDSQSGISSDSGLPPLSSFDSDKTLVMGLAQARVNWSNVIVNLSRIKPSTVWLENIKVTTPTSGTSTDANLPTAISLSGKAMTRTAAVQCRRLAAGKHFAAIGQFGRVDIQSGSHNWIINKTWQPL